MRWLVGVTLLGLALAGPAAASEPRAVRVGIEVVRAPAHRPGVPIRVDRARPVVGPVARDGRASFVDRILRSVSRGGIQP